MRGALAALTDRGAVLDGELVCLAVGAAGRSVLANTLHVGLR
jgi:hypothetical protein